MSGQADDRCQSRRRRSAPRQGSGPSAVERDAEILSLFLAIYHHFDPPDLPLPANPFAQLFARAHADKRADRRPQSRTPFAPNLSPLPSATRRFLHKAGRDELYAVLLETLIRLEKLAKQKREETG